MAENTPSTPGDALPPKPVEAKVQPRKETVRISLPPKPTASPTIKLPSLPGAPTAAATSAPTATPSVSVPPPAPSAAPSAPPVKTAAAPAKVGAAVAKPTAGAPAKPGAPAPAPKPVAPPKPPATVGVFDKVLAILALVSSLASVGTVIYLMTLLDKTAAMLEEIPK